MELEKLRLWSDGKKVNIWYAPIKIEVDKLEAQILFIKLQGVLNDIENEEKKILERELRSIRERGY